MTSSFTQDAGLRLLSICGMSVISVTKQCVNIHNYTDRVRRFRKEGGVDLIQRLGEAACCFF